MTSKKMNKQLPNLKIRAFSLYPFSSNYALCGRIKSLRNLVSSICISRV